MNYEQTSIHKNYFATTFLIGLRSAGSLTSVAPLDVCPYRKRRLLPKTFARHSFVRANDFFLSHIHIASPVWHEDYPHITKRIELKMPAGQYFCCYFVTVKNNTKTFGWQSIKIAELLDEGLWTSPAPTRKTIWQFKINFRTAYNMQSTLVQNRHGLILQRLHPQIRVRTFYWIDTDDGRE